MTSNATTLLAPWLSFYVMTGTSAAALIGLMFVVITLVMRSEQVSRSQDGLGTFSTPTVMHFCAALLVSAILSAPWRQAIYPSVLIAVVGLCGVAYVVRVMLRTKRLTFYTPDLEDWAWYSMIPLLAYSALFAGAIALEEAPASALFVLAAGVLLLIFLGIRNAWDVVTFIAVQGAARPPE